MHILFLTDTFTPENNAGAIRTHDHVKEWMKMGHRVTVLTGNPNFPAGKLFPGYRNRLKQNDRVDNIHVVRVWTYIAPNKGVARRMLDFASFMISASFFGLFIKNVDLVIATSPQFLTAVAGWFLAKVKGGPFVLEIRDLWPEQILAVHAFRKGLFIRLFESLAHFMYEQAALIISLTDSYKQVLIERGINPEKIHIVKNGVNFMRMVPSQPREEILAKYNLPRDAFLAGYIGTLGMSQGLVTIIEAARLIAADPSFHFIIMGDGAERDNLKNTVAENGLVNVTFIKRQTHQEAIDVLNAQDVSLILLSKNSLFKTVIPSKLFEAMALGKSVVLAAEGESLAMVEEFKCGLGIPQENPQALVAALIRLRADKEERIAMGKRGQKIVRKRHNRKALARDMMNTLVKFTDRT